jgi:FlaG/FlaF family flagellin (archaellin)
MPQISKRRVRAMLLLFLAGAVGAFVFGCFAPANAAPSDQDGQPAVANLILNGANCEAGYIEVSGVTRDGNSVTLSKQQDDGDYKVIDSDSAGVWLNGSVQETYRSHIVTEPGDQFIIRTLPQDRNHPEQYRLVISGLDDSVTEPFVDVRFGSSTAGCFISS